MKLAEWLAIPDDNGKRKRKREFAARIGVTPTMVTQYAQGRMWPRREIVQAITRETDGAVTANDLAQPEAAR